MSDLHVVNCTLSFACEIGGEKVTILALVVYGWTVDAEMLSTLPPEFYGGHSTGINKSKLSYIQDLGVQTYASPLSYQVDTSFYAETYTRVARFRNDEN